MRQHRTLSAAFTVLAVGALAFGTAAPASAHHKAKHTKGPAHNLSAHLDPLNNSGTTGHFTVRAHGTNLDVKGHVHGSVPLMPHAQHIHFGEQARHECPNVAKDDANRDKRINTVEGVPAYGPVAVSLTTSGDTSPASVLAIDRYPTADAMGHYKYHRKDVTVMSDAKQNADMVARAIARGEGVIVIHGVDYNGNGKYDFEGAGASELNAAFPAEATDPAACGVLRRTK